MRLHSRLIALNALAIAAVTILLSYFLSHGVANVVQSEAEEQMAGAAALAAATIRTHPDRGDPIRLADELGRLLGVRVTLIAADGTVLGDSSLTPEETRAVENHRERPEVIQALETGRGAAIRYSATVHMSFIYVAHRDGDLIVRLAKPLESVDGLINSLRWQLAIAMTGSLVAVLAFGYTVLAFVSRPLARLAEAARHLAVGDLDREIPEVRGDADLVRIGSALSAMSRSLRSKIGELVEEKNRIDTIVETMSAGVIVFDRNARAVLANRWLREALQIQGPVDGKSPLEITRQPSLEAAVRQTLEFGGVAATEWTTHQGRTLSARSAPVGRRLGEAELAVVVFHDLTEIRRLEAIRKDFVANVSHEFKTPLTSIRGYAETLLSAPPENRETLREFLAAIERNATLLSALVEDMLVLAQLEADLPMQKQPVDIRALISRQIDSRRHLLATRGIHVEIDCPERSILADPARLSRAFANLLDNAIHYNRNAGEIRISCQETARGFAIAVSDTGFGIPSEDLPRVFERFYRVEKSRDRSAGGTGLGLAIARHAIESQGGSISVTSTIGVGSTFTIVLPQEIRN
ncbi:MAG TPA: ATP-binding protein [Terriglobia bacterium]|nr:ATP-binding protein [Terriglobia bacterium]